MHATARVAAFDYPDRSFKYLDETNQALGELLEQFSQLAGHPDGHDLIFHPEAGADNSAEGVTQTVKAWRAANYLLGFKKA